MHGTSLQEIRSHSLVPQDTIISGCFCQLWLQKQ